MNDTDPQVAARFEGLLRARSGSDRVRMVSDMSADGRRILLSRYDGPPEGQKEWLFRALYEHDLPEWYVEDFVRWLRERSGAPS